MSAEISNFIPIDLDDYDYVPKNNLIVDTKSVTIPTSSVNIASGKVVITSLNFSNDVISPFEYMTDNLTYHTFLVELNAYICESLNKYFNANQLKKIFMPIMGNYAMNVINKKRYSILVKPITLSQDITEFRKKWNETYARLIELNKTTQSYLYANKLKHRYEAFDWCMYKFICRFCADNNVSEHNIAQLYHQNYLNESFKISKLIEFIESDSSDVAFIQKISIETIKQLKNLMYNYNIEYANEMAIIHKENNMKIESLNDLSSPYHLKIGNNHLLFISIYIQKIKELIDLLNILETDPRTIIIGLTSDFDLFEEKFDTCGFNISKTGSTTYKEKTIMQPKYKDIYILNDYTCDFIITNKTIEYVATYPHKNHLLPNNEHPFCNYVLHAQLS